MIIFLLLSQVFSQKLDSSYLGHLTYTLEPSQSFEHQFFQITDITSMDLYFAQPPHRRVEDQDLNCYWSFSNVGLQEVTEWSVRTQENQYGDIICLGDELCLVATNEELYLIDGRQVKKYFKKLKESIKFPDILKSVPLSQKFNRPRFIDLTAIGYIMVFDDKNIDIFDISQIFSPKLIIYQIPEQFKHSIHNSNTVQTKEFAIYINTGSNVQVYLMNQKFRLITKIQQQDSSLQDSIINENNLVEILINDQFLFVLCSKRGLLIYDITDPHSIQQYSIISDLDADEGVNQLNVMSFSVYQNNLITLHQLNNSRFAQMHLYEFKIENLVSYQIYVKSLLNGQIELPQNKNLQLKLLNLNTALLIQGNQINIVQLTKNFMTLHQKNQHANQYNLSQSEHLLPSDFNYVYQVFGKILQIQEDKLSMFQPTSESYNLICTAPSLKETGNQEYTKEYLGVIRSNGVCQEKSHLSKVSDALMTIMDREYQLPQENTKCIYTFEFTMQIENKVREMANYQKIIIYLLGLILLGVLVEYLRQVYKSKYVSRSLKQFEQLNNQLQERQKIRISHHLQDEENVQCEEYQESLVPDIYSKIDQLELFKSNEELL